MDEALLDTDILSEVLKGKDGRVLGRANRYLSEHQRFAFSAITVYEVIRGFLATQADRQLENFVQLVQGSDVLPVSVPVLDRAARLWADAHNLGHPRDDADLIIAATAIEAGRNARDGKRRTLFLDTATSNRRLATNVASRMQCYPYSHPMHLHQSSRTQVYRIDQVASTKSAPLRAAATIITSPSTIKPAAAQ